MKNYNNNFLTITENNNLIFLQHKTTGLSVIYENNNETNCSFCCGVKNIYNDNKGLPHIVEHMVFGGSKKYDYEDTFVYLDENTTYTYLNAITFKNYTTYLCSSLNSEDFQLMVDVYLDGIFNPIFKNEKFLQEVYDVKEKSGAVYNEMHSMYKDSTYAFENECHKNVFNDYRKFNPHGLCEEISTVTMNDVLEYYNKVYVPKNIVIVLSGNMDIEFYLNKIHKSLENRNVKCNFENSLRKECDDEIHNSEKTLTNFYYYKINFDNFYKKIDSITKLEFLLSNCKKNKKINDYVIYNFEKEIYVYLSFADDGNLKNVTLQKLFENNFSKIDYINYIKKLLFLYNNKDFGYKPLGIYKGIEYIDEFFSDGSANVKYIDFQKVYLKIILRNSITIKNNKIYLKNKYLKDFLYLKYKNCDNLEKKNRNCKFLKSAKNTYKKNKSCKNLNVKSVQKRKNNNNSFYFYEKNDIINMICYVNVTFDNKVSKSNSLANNLIFEFLVKNNKFYKDILDFKCETFIFNSEVIYKYYILGYDGKKTIKALNNINDTINQMNFNLEQFLEFLNKKMKDYNFLSSYYVNEEKLCFFNKHNNIITYKKDFKEKAFICCEKDISIEGYNVFNNLIEKAFEINNDEEISVNKRNDYKTYTHYLKGYESSFVFVLTELIKGEYLYPKLRFGKKAYCYNVVSNTFCFNNQSVINFIVEMADVSKCDLVFQELNEFLEKIKITENLFEKYKKMALKTNTSYKSFYKEFEQYSYEKFFNNYNEENINNINNMKFEQFKKFKEEITEKKCFFEKI